MLRTLAASLAPALMTFLFIACSDPEGSSSDAGVDDGTASSGEGDGDGSGSSGDGDGDVNGSAGAPGTEEPSPLDDIQVVDPDATAETKAVFARLRQLAATQTLFGMQHASTGGVFQLQEDGTVD